MSRWSPRPQDSPRNRRHGTPTRWTGPPPPLADAGIAPTWMPLLGSVGVAGGLLTLVVLLGIMGPSGDDDSGTSTQSPSPRASPLQ